MFSARIDELPVFVNYPLLLAGKRARTVCMGFGFVMWLITRSLLDMLLPTHWVRLVKRFIHPVKTWQDWMQFKLEVCKSNQIDKRTQMIARSYMAQWAIAHISEHLLPEGASMGHRLGNAVEWSVGRANGTRSVFATSRWWVVSVIASMYCTEPVAETLRLLAISHDIDLSTYNAMKETASAVDDWLKDRRLFDDPSEAIQFYRATGMAFGLTDANMPVATNERFTYGERKYNRVFKGIR